jgi:hypothetical protein
MAELTTADPAATTTTSGCCSSEAQSTAPVDRGEPTPQTSSCGCSAGQSAAGATATATHDIEAGIPSSARRLELYEPAMCCQTGVCGPSVDQELIDVRESLRWVESQGAAVTRHNLSSDPDAFVANPKVTGLIAAFGESALPVLVVDGDIALHGHYPSRQELAGLLDSTGSQPIELASTADSCGCEPGGCC